MNNVKKILAGDIRDACGSNSYIRGKRYYEQRKVVDIQLAEEGEDRVRLNAVVTGSGGRNYNQQIQLIWEGGYLDIEGSCSCPMRYNCKHVVAACLAYKDKRPQSQQKISVCFDWLAGLEMDAGQPDQSGEFIAYVIEPSADNKQYLLSLYLTREKKQGGLTVGRKTTTHSVLYNFLYRNNVMNADSEIARIIGSLDSTYQDEGIIKGAAGNLALKKALQTGRLFWRTHQSTPLMAGKPEALELSWQERQNGNYRLRVRAGENSLLLPTEPPLYVDTRQNRLGGVDCNGLTHTQYLKVLSAPEVPAEYVDEFSHRLVIEHPGVSLPPPKPVELTELSGLLPVPRLRLLGRELGGDRYTHLLMLRFDYGDQTISASAPDLFSVIKTEQGYVKITRDEDAETSAVAELVEFGFYPLELKSVKELFFYSAGEQTVMDSAVRWSRFIDVKLPELERQGWIIERHESFLLQFQQPENWDAEIEQADNDWFQMRFNITVNDRSLPLLPLITPVLENYDRDDLPEMLCIPLEDHHYVNMPAHQLKPFLDILYELFDSVSFDEDGNGRLSRYNAAALAELEQHHYGLFSIKGGEELIEVGHKIRQFQGIEDSPTPAGLEAELRTYQQKGLNWLQFLRGYRFGGILADDMGLGKTIQTLTHLLLERESGRMDKPSLIVAPTSLMSNWRREAERFTPALRVLILQGSERKERFEQITGHDLVLTTYPLLPRDEEILLAHEYYYLILDEAQVIKNPKAQAARIVRRIHAEHRLCLTGTPMENHLGELWAQFDFLMPGFLGDSALFKKVYRTPIEVHGDARRRERLSKRLESFLLRRTKQNVLEELPDKTEMIRSVPLHQKQAALYESIRVSMERKVREAIAEKGLARSHITILDALLKLRQTCCDPRTLALKEAQKLNQSAKLDLLMEMLPELLEEGRRILLFSQFTKMLGLIEAELNAKKIAYSKLTGQTRKREEAIEQFKSGEVDVFLISLKAGGVGLNLTEADTVIIYDPWWNPAVESQAADRAHRIGQDKAVFVYKLITENTVEEKILELQEKKRKLAESVYNAGNKEEAFQLSADDLNDLFKPIDVYTKD